MSHFSHALTEIVERSFDGKSAELARASGVAASGLSRMASGRFEPTLEKLGDLCKVLNRHDRKQLLMAAAMDRIPVAFQNELFGDEDPASQILRAKLSPDLAAVIRYLESSAMSDEMTANYLRRIGKWAGILSASEEPAMPVLKAAEGPSVTYRRAKA